MNKNIFIIVLIVALLVLGFLWFNDSSDYKAKIKVIQEKRDSLEMVEARLIYKNDSLLNLEPEIRWRYAKAKDELEKQQDETDEIPGVVSTYSIRKLDSILTNHRFRPRTKSSNSIND